MLVTSNGASPERGLLHVPPGAFPELIAAHEAAVIELQDLLNDLNLAGRIPEPWTHDPVAQEIAARFNTYAVDGEGSAYACLRLYQQELQRVADTLRQMHAAYQAGEDANEATMRTI